MRLGISRNHQELRSRAIDRAWAAEAASCDPGAINRAATKGERYYQISHRHEGKGAEAASNHATHRRDDLEKSARPASRLGSTDAARPTGGFLKVIPT